MSQNSEMNHARVNDLDPQKVGEILINAGTASELAGHATPKGTMKDYVHPDYLDTASPELEFVRDMFVCTTAEITKRWYGGELAAAVRAADAIAAIIHV
jgi:hypothetical protein